MSVQDKTEAALLRLFDERNHITLPEAVAALNLSGDTVSQTLYRLYRRGILHRQGIGGHTSPYRYRLNDRISDFKAEMAKRRAALAQYGCLPIVM